MFVNTRIGILGGGQLGKMLLQAASRWDLNTWVMDKEFDFPAGKVTNQFIKGDFTDEELVYQLGKHVDIVTIEIENVNTSALHKLEEEGKEIYPQPSIIDTIKDKGLQKEFYRSHDLPTSDFKLYEDAEAIRKAVEEGSLTIPFVQKARTEGYDGRGVHIVRVEDDLEKLLDVKSVVEHMVPIDREIAVIGAKNPSGDIAIYPPVEMRFHPTANLVEELISPASITPDQLSTINGLAHDVLKAFDIVGLLAIELFIAKDGSILINEVAPRPHNSGHHSIEGNMTSQYEQHLRAILDLPLGNTAITSPAVMINILGEPGYSGEAYYEGLETCLAMDNVHIHLYGKSHTKPFRKMGHVTILAEDVESARQKAREVRKTLKCKC